MTPLARWPPSFHEQVAVKPLEGEGFPEESQSVKGTLIKVGAQRMAPLTLGHPSMHTRMGQSKSHLAAQRRPCRRPTRDRTISSSLSSLPVAPFPPLFSMWANWRVGGCAQADFLRLLQSQKSSQSKNLSQNSSFMYIWIFNTKYVHPQRI